MKDLQPLEAGLKAKLAESGVSEGLQDALCMTCYMEFKKLTKQGNSILAQEKAKEARRRRLWKQRVVLFKRGRRGFENKILSEATQAYEQYISLIEKVFEVKKGQLSPEQFRSVSQKQELTIITSVYWDLLRIYDTNPKYKEAQNEAAKQLAKFARFTPVYPDIIRKAKAFRKKSKNPDAVKEFLKLSKAGRPRCFIATAAFGSTEAHEVQILAWFRDHYLSQRRWGRAFVRIYYLLSPPIASTLDACPWAKPGIRSLLRALSVKLESRTRGR